MKNSTFVPIKETLILTVGEAICSAIVCLVFLAIGKYDFGVLLGAILGSGVIILNFLFMSIAVNRAIDQAFALRDSYVDEPCDENAAPQEAVSDTDEDASDADADGDESGEGAVVLDAAMRFAQEQSVRVSRVSKISYIIRTACMIALLVVALISKWFNPISAIIPMLMMRPLIMAEGLIRNKNKF